MEELRAREGRGVGVGGDRERTRAVARRDEGGGERAK
jgi:hypothetical protein